MGRLREFRHTPFGNVAITLFLCAQAADGVLTYLGVSIFGSAVEANPFIATLMHEVGPAMALVGAKLAAMGLGAVLHILTVHRLVAILTGVYTAAAVVPWLYLLFIVPTTS